jgi:hypothetical protein
VELENVANDSGVTLKSVAPDTSSSAGDTATTSGSSSTGDATQAPSPQNYAFTISVIGTYPSLMRVFSDLEASARPMRVTGLSIAGSGSSLTAQISVTTYFMDKAVLPIGTESIK